MKLQLRKYKKTINWGYNRRFSGTDKVPSSTTLIFNSLLSKPSTQRDYSVNGYGKDKTYDTAIFGTTTCKESSVYNVHNEAGNAIMWYANEKKTTKTTRLYDASDCIALIKHFEEYFGFKNRSEFYQIGEANAVVMEYSKEWAKTIFASSFLMQLIRGGAYYTGDLEKFIKGTYVFKLQDKRHLKSGEVLLRRIIEKKSLELVDALNKMMFVQASENLLVLELTYEKIKLPNSFMLLYDHRPQSGHQVTSVELVLHNGELKGVSLNTRT